LGFPDVAFAGRHATDIDLVPDREALTGAADVPDRLASVLIRKIIDGGRGGVTAGHQPEPVRYPAGESFTPGGPPNVGQGIAVAFSVTLGHPWAGALIMPLSEVFHYHYNSPSGG
jgi:hypothetical protein